MHPTSNRFAGLSPLKQALLAVEEMQSRLAESERERTEPIAVIGVGCRFPHADDPESFWKLLRNGEDAVGDVPASRWRTEDYYDPNPDAPGKMSTRWGGFLRAIDQFDPAFFGISPREAIAMDPQQRLLLEVSWEALENAGQGPRALIDCRTGVFVGIASDEFSHLFFRQGDYSAFNAYFASGIARSVAGGRISYTLGIEGPNLSIDTACSSSLVAVHTACLYLRMRECRMALAGGANVILSPEIGVSFTKSHMMAADGRCKAFDSRADGFVRGEGCGIVVLKRLSDAVADGDRIMALIRGSAVNQDGRSSGLTVPNLSAQQTVIRQALANGLIEPHEIGYVEAHGTGTSLGDPIEARALATVLGAGRAQTNPLIVGSVKTNLGHLEAAAGVAGLIKTILALENEEIPEHLHFREMNPLIDWSGLPIEISAAPRPWLRGEKRRLAGVSAFGFSGTNAHMVLEEAPVVPAAQRDVERPLHLLALSAHSDVALGQLAERYTETLGRSGAEAGDVCYTANAGRAHFGRRLIAAGASTQEIRARLAEALPGKRCQEREGIRPVFLFPGQGAQYAGMGKELYQTQPVFRRTLDECAQLLEGELREPLLEVLWGSATELLDQTGYTQPALFAVEYALARLWQSWGIEPAVVLGHSVGEYVAACVAGMYGLADGLRLIAARGRLMQAVAGRGGMLAVQAGEAEVRSALAGLEQRVSIAALNGPRSVVVSGYERELGVVEERLVRAGARVKRLQVSHGFHSPQMAEMEDAFERVAGGLAYNAPRIELISSVTGHRVTQEELSQASYWRRQVRQPVRFAEALEGLRKYRVFLEAGPGTALAGMGRQCLGEAQDERPDHGSSPDDGSGEDARLWVTSLRNGRGEWEQMLENLGRLYVWGAEVNWEGFDAPYGRRKVALPTYPFERQRYWPETKTQTPPAGGYVLTGRSLDVAGSSPLQVWETRIGLTDQPYLADHRALGNAIFPLAGYLEMALAAAGPRMALEDIVIRESLVLPPEEPKTVQTIRRGDAIEVFSMEEGSWKQHFTARAAAMVAPVPSARPQDLCAAMKRTGDVRGFYEFMRNRGMDFGPAFHTVQELWTAPAEAVARIAPPESLALRTEGYSIHPAILDGCFQIVAAALPEGGEDLFLPVRLERFQVYRSSAAELWAHAVRRPITLEAPNTAVFDISVTDDCGPVANARGMEFVRVPARRPSPLFELRWEAKQRGAAPGRISGDWLILPDRTGAATALAKQLSAWGADCTILETAGGLKAAVAEKEWAGIVHLRSLDAPPASALSASLLSAAQRTVCGSALELVQALAAVAFARPPRLWLVTRGAQMVSTGQERIEVVQSMLWGMAQGIGEEHPEWRCTSIDLDPAGSVADVNPLCAEIGAAGREDQVAFRSGERLVARLGIRETKTQLEIPRRLTIASRGVLDNLGTEPATRRTVPPSCVEIEVHAAGLNFRDVLNALGMFSGPLGSECAGRIVAVGGQVEEFAEGDEVVAFAAGSHDGFVLADARLVAPRPVNLTAEQAVTLPTAFLTARYTLERIANIRRGDRVLIHAAAGGVGLAAVRIAQRAGAEIFATAGSERKRAFLRSLGVEHIMNSRTVDFAREILEATGGRGVDIVLNSLAGEFIHASFSALAPGGCFIEIGKRDIWTAEQVEQLARDIRYHIVDLGRTAVDDPALVGLLLRDTVKAVEQGELHPLPSVVFSFDDAVSAYRYMAQAHHIGKVVLRQSACAAAISADATYLVTGGFGGIGSQLLRWLVRRGARHVVLVGRNGPGGASRESVAWAEAQGARVAVRLADMANAGDVAGLLSGIAAEMPPLRGILHAAGVLDDGVLTEQNFDRFERVLAPKTTGSWLLHELTAALPLDFFVMFSSIAAILGAPGQANYAAANAFQDALAHERHRRGLPAISIDWGPWLVGMATRVGVDARLHQSGVESMSPEEALGLLSYILLEKPVQAGAALVRWNKLVRRYPKDRVPCRFEALVVAADAPPMQNKAEASLLETLAGTPDSRRNAVLREHLHALAQRVLGFPASRRIDFHQPLNELGLDSLMAVEFRNLLAAQAGQNLPSTLLFNYPALDDVAAHLAGLLFGSAAAAESTVSRPGASHGVLDAIEDLSDEDVDRLLASGSGAVTK